MEKFDLGDVKILSVKITHFDGSTSVDIRQQIGSISVYEDLQQPTIYAELLVNDAVNLVKDFPITGNEMIEIVFKTPTREELTTYKLKVYTIEGQGTRNSGQATAYVLKAVSEEHFRNTDFNITSSYKDTIDNIVYDIIKNQLKTDKPLFIERTRGLTPISFARDTPFACVDLLRKRAVNLTPFGGVFYFYENQYGFHFKSVDKMIEEGKSTIQSKEFYYEPMVSTDKIRSAYQYRNLIRFEHLKKADTALDQISGMFSNKVASFDIFTKNFTETKFNLSEQKKNINTGQTGRTELPYDAKFLNNKSNANQVNLFVPSDTERGNDYIKDLLGHKHSLLQILNLNIVRGMIYGDNIICVGDMIKLNLPETSSFNEKEKYDSRYSGNYVIQKLRHLIVPEDNRFKYYIAFDANKIGITG
jgi:hypothetical protein